MRRLRAVALGISLIAGLVVAGRSKTAVDHPPRPLAPHDAVVLPSTEAVDSLPAPRLARRLHPYAWPLWPFDRAHPIRGGFGDPRFGAYRDNFHFGIDISAPGGTPVYSVAAGTAFIEPDHVDVLAHIATRRASGFSYWHIYPAVSEHAFVARHALLGWVKPIWGHLHFSELDHGRYVNPLRPGALTPVPPAFQPTIASIAIAPTAAGKLNTDGYTGRIAIVADVYTKPPSPPPPWQNAVVAPTLIRWRLLQDGSSLTGWRIAVDFRAYIPANPTYHDLYAPGTRPDRPNRAGTYLYYLARNWNLDTIPAGSYQIQVQADGTRGATTEATTTFQVEDDQPPPKPAPPPPSRVFSGVPSP